MKSFLLSIGCDKYASGKFGNLSGAENDAYSIYNCLVESEYTIYDSGKSKVLKSPTVSEFKNALEDILFNDDPPDIFTLFFAGHGGVLTGTYYLCLKDTRPERMSLSAFSLSDLFRIISSSEVKHVNLVIDACNTGGLVNDLNSLIKPEIIGAKGSFGIAILAAAASDEYAGERAGQGLLTGNLIKYINGSRPVTSDTEFLDLVSVGRVLSTEFIENASDQTPSSWGINLYGPSIFAKNPFYHSNEAINVYKFSYIPPASRLGKLISKSKKEFWEILDNIEDSNSSNLLLASFQKLLSNTDDIDDALTLITGIGYRFVEQVDASSNLKKLELINVLLTALMPYIGNEKAEVEIDRLINTFSRVGKICLLSLSQELDEKNEILIYRGGKGFDLMANYFYLSIRISQIFGMLAQLILIDRSHIKESLKIVELIYLTYPKQLLCMSEIQAPYLYVFFKTFFKFDLLEKAKPILIKYLVDLLKSRGQVSRLDIDPEKSLTFLLQRYTQENILIELTANPGQLGTALLHASSEYNIEEDLDHNIHFLDRCNFLLFIPSQVKEFSQNQIENGHNLILCCGHDFWETRAFSDLCSKHINKYMHDKPSDNDNRSLICCISSSFIQPDRLPIMFM